ncbi:MAG: response regulator transcription factor [Pseudomonadota bacterium]
MSAAQLQTQQKLRVLTADDDRAIRSAIERHFTARGFQVTTAEDGLVALNALKHEEFDLAVLDINMPGLDGLSLCRHIREKADMPVILLTANGEETDRIVGLELGADDYMCKPFSVRELEARIKSVMRRCGQSSTATSTLPEPANDEVRQFGHWSLNLSRRELYDKDDNPVPLTGAEFRLLDALTSKPNRVLSRDQLMNMTRGHDAMPFDRSIDVQIGRLRKKLGDSGKQPSLIKTFRGEGYVLTA